MRRLLDTNIYAQLKRGHEETAELLRSAERVYFSIVVLGELYFGFHDGSRFQDNVAQLEEFLSHPFVSIANLTRITADRFGRISTHLRRTGTPIPTNDIWIAAQTMELGAELVTCDEHFRRVPGLVVLIPGQ
jgi:tRNA(fMet)-specific endonuclease VapC